MAVYVLLTFEKDDDAKKFVASTLQDRQVAYEPLNADYERNDTNAPPDVEWVDANVRGVWKKPTLFCTRENKACNSRSRGFTRGRKYGWWVCSGCGKPSPLWSQGNAWFTALGTNLIPQSQLAPEYRPPGWDSTAAWDFLPSELLNSVEPHVEWQFKNQGNNVTVTKVPR